jgi:hypothetical protein
MDGAAQCDILDRPPPRRYRPDSPHRREIEQRDREFLETMRANPEASAEALAAILGVGKGSVVGRWYRFAREGVLIKGAGGRWRLPTPGEQPSAEPGEEELGVEPLERVRPAYNPHVWVQHIDYYVREVTSLFACRRFG